MEGLKNLLKAIRRAIARFVDFIFQNVPRNYVKFPVTGFIFTGETYVVDGVLYEELAHEDQPGLRIVLDVHDNRVVKVIAGNRVLVL